MIRFYPMQEANTSSFEVGKTYTAYTGEKMLVTRREQVPHGLYVIGIINGHLRCYGIVKSFVPKQEHVEMVPHRFDPGDPYYEEYKFCSDPTVQASCNNFFNS